MYKYEKQGLIHKKTGLLCQDVVEGVEKEGILVLAAADGASATNNGRRGAQLTVQVLLELFSKYFHQLHNMQKKDIQYQLIEKIREQLYEECERCNTDLQDMKSTFIAVAYEKTTGKMIRVHLGDGYVIVKDSKGYRFHSYPDNKGNRYTTYLTNMIPVSHRIQVFTGYEKELEEIYLLTDGWLEIAGSDKEILKLVRRIEQKNDWEAQDDLGCISKTIIK